MLRCALLLLLKIFLTSLVLFHVFRGRDSLILKTCILTLAEITKVISPNKIKLHSILEPLNKVPELLNRTPQPHNPLYVNYYVISIEHPNSQ